MFSVHTVCDFPVSILRMMLAQHRTKRQNNSLVAPIMFLGTGPVSRKQKPRKSKAVRSCLREFGVKIVRCVRSPYIFWRENNPSPFGVCNTSLPPFLNDLKISGMRRINSDFSKCSIKSNAIIPSKISFLPSKNWKTSATLASHPLSIAISICSLQISIPLTLVKLEFLRYWSIYPGPQPSSKIVASRPSVLSIGKNLYSHHAK